MGLVNNLSEAAVFAPHLGSGRIVVFAETWPRVKIGSVLIFLVLVRVFRSDEAGLGLNRSGPEQRDDTKKATFSFRLLCGVMQVLHDILACEVLTECSLMQCSTFLTSRNNHCNHSYKTAKYSEKRFSDRSDQ